MQLPERAHAPSVDRDDDVGRLQLSDGTGPADGLLHEYAVRPRDDLETECAERNGGGVAL